MAHREVNLRERPELYAATVAQEEEKVLYRFNCEALKVDSSRDCISIMLVQHSAALVELSVGLDGGASLLE